jgi:formate dehydrogenase subunit beta
MDQIARSLDVGTGDATIVMRELLWRLMDRGVVHGLLVPLQTSLRESPAPTLIKNRERLEKADPLAPVMLLNSAKVAAMLLEQESDKRLGVVLRPCEARALVALADCGAVSLDRLVTISIDCLGSHEEADYDQRINTWGDDVPVRESLRWSRRGQIAPYRYRWACRICERPYFDAADISIGLFGQRLSESLLVVTDAVLADQIGLDDIGHARPVDGQSDEVVKRHKTIDDVASRRREWRRRAFLDFKRSHKVAADMLSLFETCCVCGECQEACPLTGTPLSRFDIHGFETNSREYTEARLLDIVVRSEYCSGCGMCETACSRGIPLLLLTQLLAGCTRLRTELVTICA